MCMHIFFIIYVHIHKEYGFKIYTLYTTYMMYVYIARIIHIFSLAIFFYSFKEELHAVIYKAGMIENEERNAT